MVEPNGSTFPPLEKVAFFELLSAGGQCGRASLAGPAGMDELYAFYRKIHSLYDGQGVLMVEKIGEQIALTFGD